MQHNIGETNFTVPSRPSKLLKHSRNLGLEADPTTLSSCSSTVKMKNYLNMVSNENPSPEEKKIASIQSSVSSSHDDIGIQLKTLLDWIEKETESFVENNKAKHNNKHYKLQKS